MSAGTCGIAGCPKPVSGTRVCHMHYMRKRRTGSYELQERPLEDRFWALVDRAGGDEVCWLWQGTRDSGGYGRFKVNGHFERSSRVAYELTYGSLPGGAHVLHSCDTPACCNVRHLRAGSHADNMRDRTLRRREARGFALPQTRLSEADVATVRALVRGGRSQNSVAERFGITQGYVSELVSGRKRSHRTVVAA